MNAGLTTDFHDDDGELAYLLISQRIFWPKEVEKPGRMVGLCVFCDHPVLWDEEDYTVAMEHHVITSCTDCAGRARKEFLLIKPSA